MNTPHMVWNAPGERFFQAGVDRVVLYANGFAGVPWSGVASIKETPTGGEALPYYFDAIKYANVTAAEEFSASIDTYTIPKMFDSANGIEEVVTGLFITAQPRKTFDFCYRNFIGNDIEGVEHAYQIHLVYNALALPIPDTHSTLSNSTEATLKTVSVSTRPEYFIGSKPTAHVVADSRYTPPHVLQLLEDVLYGTSSSTAMMPTPDELIAIFTTPEV